MTKTAVRKHPPNPKPIQWLKAMKKLGTDQALKLARNFRLETRVSAGAWKKFTAKVNRQLKNGTDPVAAIEPSISLDMMMNGPLAKPSPVKPLPDLLARVETMDMLEKRLAVAGGRRYANQKAIVKAINNQSIVRDLPPEIVHVEGGPFLWIADGNEVEALFNRKSADEFRDRLGLFKGFKKGKHPAVMTFPRSLIHNGRSGKDPTVPIIPTVMEGKDNPAFTPAPRKEKRSGMLIDLKTGLPTVPEWVCARIKNQRGFGFLPMDPPDLAAWRLVREPANEFLALYGKMKNENGYYP